MNLVSKKVLINSKSTTIILVAFSLVFYSFFAFQVPRTDFWINLLLYTLLFGFYLLFVTQKLNWKLILTIGVAFRLIFLFSTPELSDDFYRFYWDGLQTLAGNSPFAYLPSEITTPQLSSVYAKLNSPNYYSVYPGVNQLIYTFCAFIGQSLTGFVLTAKILMLMSELLSFYLIYRLLQLKNKASHLLSWYFLNPLIILEFMGNLHFEGFMSCAILASVYFLTRTKTAWSATCLGFACAIKIMPFLFVPLYLLKTKKSSAWLFLVLPPLVFGLTLIPFYHEQMFVHILQSVQLYFGEFEFNSSIYLVSQALGLPKITLKLFLLLDLSLILLWVYQQKISFSIGLVWLFTSYLFLSQSIHPWYVAGFLAIATFKQQRYMILWTFLIFLTYITYQSTNYQQQVWVNIIEYVLVACFLTLEIKQQ